MRRWKGLEIREIHFVNHSDSTSCLKIQTDPTNKTPPTVRIVSGWVGHTVLDSETIIEGPIYHYGGER